MNRSLAFFACMLISSGASAGPVEDCLGLYERGLPGEGYECMAVEAQRENARAQYYVARAYELGFGVTSNYHTMIEWLEKASANDHGEATLVLAIYLYYEDHDTERHVLNLEKSRIQGSVSALLIQGELLIGPDPGTAREYLDAAIGAIRDEPKNPFDFPSLFQVARLYEDGVAIPSDPETAERLHADAWGYTERQASLGNPLALRMLGLYQIQSDDPNRDVERGLELLRDAALKGDLISIGELAEYYRYGSYGVPADPVKAFEMARLGAERGLALAQLALGEMYYRGEGVAKNEQLGLYWLNEASNGRNQFAAETAQRRLKKHAER